jgi:guanylate kinase
MSMTAMVLVGSTGSGTTFLSGHIADQFDSLAICEKVTTRERRANEAVRAAYRFVDESTFCDLLASGQLVQVQFSYFDNSKYGLEKEALAQIVEHGRSPILTCHSVEEAQALKLCLNAHKITVVCVYLYAFEPDRKRALTRSGEVGKFMTRYPLDIAFKIQAYQKQFADCNYVLVNRYDANIVAQVEAIVHALQSDNTVTECDISAVHESIGAEIQWMLQRLRHAASEV